MDLFLRSCFRFLIAANPSTCLLAARRAIMMTGTLRSYLLFFSFRGSGGEDAIMAASTGFKQACPSCEKMVPIKDPKLIGKKVECPNCKYRFTVEAPEEESDADIV